MIGTVLMVTGGIVWAVISGILLMILWRMVLAIALTVSQYRFYRAAANEHYAERKRVFKSPIISPIKIWIDNIFIVRGGTEIIGPGGYWRWIGDWKVRGKRVER